MNFFEVHYAEIAERNKIGRTCETCGNEIRKSDDKATTKRCGFCATVHSANITLADNREDNP